MDLSEIEQLYDKVGSQFDGQTLETFQDAIRLVINKKGNGFFKYIWEHTMFHYNDDALVTSVELYLQGWRPCLNLVFEQGKEIEVVGFKQIEI